MLTMEQAKQLLATTTTQEHLFLHAKNVSVAMGGIARHLGADAAHWEAIGYLHDYDYEQFPEEHLQHTEQPLLDAGLSAEEVRAILRQEAERYPQIHIIDCWDFIPHEEDYFYDRRLHPNDAGVACYAEALFPELIRHLPLK